MRRLLLAATLLLFASATSAETPAQGAQKAAAAQKQLRETRARIKALAAEQRRLEDERGSAARALRNADDKVAGSQRSLQQTEAGIAAQELALAQLQERQQQLEVKLSQQRTELAALLRSAYALGRHQQLKLLLEQDRMSDLARVLAYHRYFERDRSQRIAGLRSELASLAQVGEEIRSKQLELLAARARQQKELATVAAQRRERGALLSSLDSRYRDRSARLTALGRDEKSTVVLLERLRKLMAQLPKPKPKAVAKPPAAALPGKPGKRLPAIPATAAVPLGRMKLPLAGTLLAGYGGQMPDGHKSQGLLIAGNAGAQVHAVSAGRVAYADWLKGYGLLVILDHGNGLMSLYAFNDVLLKSTGDSVAAGEAIATVGSSGGQGRPALYFELRRNGHPQDPRSWLSQ